MSVTITKIGDLVKIDNGSGEISYFNKYHVPEAIKIDANERVSIISNSQYIYNIDLANLIINGVVPASVSEFEASLNSLIAPIFDRIDSSILAAYSSTSLTSPVRRMAVLGNNPDVDTATVPETIWPSGGLYPWMTGATSLEAVSTSVQDSPTGTGMGAISLTLLNTSYVASIVPVTLNGTSAVPISGSWFRVNAGITTTKGSGAPATRAINIGDIIIRDAGGGTVRAIIPAGKGILRQAVFTVEAGYSLQIVSHYISLNRGTGGGAGVNKFLSVTNFIQNSAGVARTPLDLSCDGEPYRHDGIPGVVLPEKTDYSLDAISVSADSSDVTAAFLGVLVKNELISTITY